MPRPRLGDRQKVASLTLTLRLTEHEKALLEALVERRKAELEAEGGDVSLASYVRTLIRRDAKEKGVEPPQPAPDVSRKKKARAR